MKRNVDPRLDRINALLDYIAQVRATADLLVSQLQATIASQDEYMALQDQTIAGLNRRLERACALAEAAVAKAEGR